VFVDDRRADRLFRDRDRGSPVIESTSSLAGYEEAGVPMGLEDD
jgi:hypothetical protein